jgi:hypothetical protein
MKLRPRLSSQASACDQSGQQDDLGRSAKARD